jgi:hypothetical protein
MIAIHQHVLAGNGVRHRAAGWCGADPPAAAPETGCRSVLVAVLLLAGVFAPLLARQVLDGALLTAVLIVLVLWSVWYAVRLSRCASDWWSQRLAARPAAATGAPPPDARSEPPTAAAQSPFGGDQADASQQEGGRDDA